MAVTEPFELVNGVPSVLIDGASVGAEDARARVPDNLRYEHWRYPCMGQS
jgi:hypothetical protein